MAQKHQKIELLSPAKNAEFGIEAINHGADAVYIGASAFGARASAGNGIKDIEDLCTHAHRFNAKVFVAVNTILKDEEIDSAVKLIKDIYHAGADALIIQDMGLLETDLPPIEIHASTQCDIRTPEKALFLEKVGFSQLVLARELSLQQIKRISDATTASLEFFVHGALCVSYSGQCYISHATTGRSANRGDCSQACRLPYSVQDQAGTMLTQKQHVLSLKDNNQSANLKQLIDAGIRSFKIEGRLKDLTYVKNVTAYYRQQLDLILEDREDISRSSSGRERFTFSPKPEKSFNRGATDYFVTGRKDDIGSFDSPKYAGEHIGVVSKILRDGFEIETNETVVNGDGISYYTADNTLEGIRVSVATRTEKGFRISPNGKLPAPLCLHTAIYRNYDKAFEQLLEKKSAERKIPIVFTLTETDNGFQLSTADSNGTEVSTQIECIKEIAQDSARSLDNLSTNLGKLGNTIFEAQEIRLQITQPWFIPASLINNLRRQAIADLEVARQNRRPRGNPGARDLTAQYPEDALTYLGNVYNAYARKFYEKHGVSLIAPAYECGLETGDVSLMITKHCVRFSLQLCPKQTKGIRPDPLILTRGNEKFTLKFDCKPCEMHVIGKKQRLKDIKIKTI